MSRRPRSPSSMPATSGWRPSRAGSPSAQLAARRGIVPALLAGRQDARLSRQLRRQHRHLHGARAGRRSVAPDVHPMTDRVLDWYPDGTRVLFASSRESSRQRYNQFYLVAAKGGPAEKVPVPYGEFATFSPDGKQVAYLPQSQAFRTWKRYRGGWAPDVWTFDLATKASANVTASDANDEHPMWHGDTLYFLSDRGANQRANIWARDKSGDAAPGDAVRRLRRDVPGPGPPGHRVRGGRPPLPAEPGDGESERGRHPGRHRPDHPQAAHRVGRRVDPRGGALAHRQARGVPGARRRVHGPRRTRPRAEPHAQLGIGGAVSALVAGRQDARLLDRPLRRVRAGAPAGRRHGHGKSRHDARPGLSLSGAVVAGQRPTRVHRSDRDDAAAGRGQRQAHRDRSGADLDGARRAWRTCRCAGRPTRAG